MDDDDEEPLLHRPARRRQPKPSACSCKRASLLVLASVATAYLTVLKLFPEMLDEYARRSLNQLMACEMKAFKAAGVDTAMFLNCGILLGTARSGGWIPHDRFSEGNGDFDLGLVLDSAEFPTELVRRLRHESYRLCGNFILTRQDWFQTSIMRLAGNAGAYGMRLSLMRIYSPWAPFVFADVDDYVPHSQDQGALLCRDPLGGRRLPAESEGENGARSLLRRSDVLPLAPCSFEGITLMCPANLSGVLEYEYGSNWRTPLRRGTYTNG